MTSAPSPVYLFGPFRLSTGQRTLTRAGEVVPLTPKAFDMLVMLVRQSGITVPKDALLRELWPGTFVEEGNLTVHMSALRRALGDAAEGSAFIETIPRHGYRFCVPVEVVAEEPRLLVMERHRETRIVREEIEEEIVTPQASRSRIAAVAAGVLLISAAALAGWRFANKAAASPAAPMRVVPFASYSGELHMPAFAPDGQRVAFPWTGPDGKNWDIYVKLLGNDPPLRLTSDASSDGAPAWSPDGRQIAFLRNDQVRAAIYVVGALGGPERKLLDLPHARYFDLDWSPDGKHIAFAMRTRPGEDYNSPRFMAVFILSLETGERRQITFPNDPERDQRFAFSPDGATLAFLRYDGQVTGIWLVPVGGGDARKIYEERGWIGHAAFVPDGKSLLFTSAREGGNKLFRIPAEGGTPELLPLGEDEAYSPTIARQGNRMAYLRLVGDYDLWRVEMKDLTAKPALQFRATARAEFAPEFSPEGKRIAFLSEATGHPEVWVGDAAGSNAVPITSFHLSNGSTPSWSPDGKEITFSSLRGPQGSPAGIFAVNVETRAVRRLSDEGYAMPWWSRDGRWIYLAFNSLFGKKGIWKVPAIGGPLIPVSDVDALMVQEAPDGNALYFCGMAGGIWKIPAQGGKASVVVPEFHNGWRAYWRVVGDGIYFLSGDVSGHSFEYLDLASGRRRRIAEFASPFPRYLAGMTVSPDGKSIVFARQGRETSEIMLVENFQ